jgi:hypothetical protein
VPERVSRLPQSRFPIALKAQRQKAAKRLAATGDGADDLATHERALEVCAAVV